MGGSLIKSRSRVSLCHLCKNGGLILALLLLSWTFLFLPNTAHALEWQKDIVSIDLNGYYKNLFTVTDTHNLYKDMGIYDRRYFIDDYNRLRLKSTLIVGKHFSFNGHYELHISNGDTIWAQYRTQRMIKRMTDIIGPLPEDDPNTIFLSMLNSQGTPRFMDMEESLPLRGAQRIAHGIDRLYASFRSRFVQVEVGRMALSWGTGRMWNPTDMWAPFSPTEIDKEEKRGVDLVHATFKIPKVGNLEGVFMPLDANHNYEFDQDDRAAGGRFKFHIGEYDISMMGGVFGPDTVTGLDFTGYLWNAGFRGEATYTFVNPDDHEPDYIRGVLSLDYGFAVFGNPYLLLEGFFNGLGESDPDNYMERLTDKSVQRMMAMGRAFNFGRDYITLMGTFQPHPLVTLSISPIMNIDDQSAFVSFSVKYAVTDYAEFISGVYSYIGRENTEFGGLEIDEHDMTMKNPDMVYLYLKAYF